MVSRFGARRVSARQACPGGTLYRIRLEDTLWNLSRPFGVEVDEILAANPGLDPQNLRVGQVICIPGAGAEPPVPELEPEPEPEPGPPSTCPGGVLYVIRSRDTFYLIAQRYGISLERLIQANPGVDPDQLEVGSRICIPEVAVELPCTIVLRPSGTNSEGIGSGLLWQTDTGRIAVTMAASGLPEPSELDPSFTDYSGWVWLFDQPRPESFRVFMERADSAAFPDTWAGTGVLTPQYSQRILSGDALLEVRALISGLRGPDVLNGDVSQCVG